MTEKSKRHPGWTMEVELWDLLKSRDKQIFAACLSFSKQLRINNISICASRGELEKYMQFEWLDGARRRNVTHSDVRQGFFFTVISFPTADSWLSSTCTAGGTLTSQPKVRMLYVHINKFVIAEDKLCFSCTNARDSTGRNEMNKPYKYCDEQTDTFFSLWSFFENVLFLSYLFTNQGLQQKVKETKEEFQSAAHRTVYLLGKQTQNSLNSIGVRQRVAPKQ